MDFAADKVWALLSDFGTLDWLLVEHKLEVTGDGSPGTVRILKIEGAEPVWEVLLAKDVATRTLSYAVPVGLQFPVANYSATMKIEATGKGSSRLNWHSTWFTANDEDAETAMTEILRIYNVLADGIETVLGKAA